MSSDSSTIEIDESELERLIDERVQERLEEEPQRASRRQFLASAAGVAGAGALGYVGGREVAGAPADASGTLYVEQLGDSNNPVKELYVDQQTTFHDTEQFSTVDITDELSIDSVLYPNEQRLRGHRQVAAAPVVSNWTKEASNPVVENTESYESDGISEAAVTFVGGKFVMLYGADDGVNIAINRAISDDGINWTKDSSNPVLSSNDAGNPVGQMSVGYVNGEYVMYARDTSTNEIRYFTSTDGVNWTDNGVVLSPSSSGWDGSALYNSCFLKAGGTWYVWYEATGGDFQIGLAVGNSPTSLEKFADPVIETSTSGVDSNAAYNPSVYYDGGMFYMWYGANDGNEARTALATSTDGVHWTKHGEALPTGAAGTWDSTQAMDPSVLRVGERFYMWYKGADAMGTTNQQIGLAVNDMGVTLP